jgi:PIN domain nuclease of toxin-antitoxin system
VPRLRTDTRRRGLSLGDRACLALAETPGLPAVTADRHWAQPGLSIDIRPIR